jgi:ABC-type sulfate transport system permease component
MPLAIYMALESDVRVAVALSLLLGAVSVALLFALRAAPSAWALLHAARAPRTEAAP